MSSWLSRWILPKAWPSARRPRPGRGSRYPRLQVEELESRLTPSGGTPSLNLPLTSDPDVQQMPSIAVDPLDPEHLVVSYMDRSLVQTGYAGIGVAVSRDGGDSWERQPIELPNDFDQGAANPITRFDARGHVFVSFMAATFLGANPGITNPSIFNPDLGVRERTLGFTANNGIFVARSDDGGLTWNQPVAVDSYLYDGQNRVPFDIIPDLAIDTFRTLPNGQPNPNYGNLYESWSRYYPSGQFPGEPTALGGSNIMFAVSRDGGLSWKVQLEDQPAESSEPITVIYNNGAFTGLQFPEGLGLENWSHVTVGPEGDIYVSQFLGAQFAVHHSFDGGASFDHPNLSTGERLPFGLNTPIGPGPLSSNQFRLQNVRAIVADPTRPGVVYVADSNQINDPQGNVEDEGDVVFARSTDYGATWQRTFRVGTHSANVLNDENDGRSATGRVSDVAAAQAMPRLVSDAQGDVALIWYDLRRDPASHLLDVFGTVSSDGGLTFSANFRVTDLSFDADAGRFIDATGKTNYYLGDTIGLAVANQTAYAAWTDTRNGNQDIFFARYGINPAPLAANDRFEPNDTAASATDVGRVIARSLPKLAISQGDEDWFRVRTAATGSLTVQTSLALPRDSVHLELFDDTGATLLATGTAVLDGSGQAIGQILRFPTPAGRTYLVRVLPDPGVSGNPARYTLSVQSLTADLGSQVHGVETGSLAAGDEAFFKLLAEAPGSLEVTLTPGPNVQGNLRLELLDPSNPDIVLASGQSAGAGQHASLVVAKGRAVYFHIVGDAGAQGDYTLEFSNLDQFTTTDNSVLFFPTGDGASEGVLADLNGDGKLDVVVSRVGRDAISVLLNNGDGTFQAPRDFAVGAFQQGGPFTLFGLQNFHRDLGVGDFNADGVPDLAVVNTSSSDISILIGRGDGTFEPQRRYDATAAPFALDVGDVNNDGILDLVVIDSTADAAQGGVLLGRGDGTFQLLKPFTPPAEEPFRTNSIRIADLNHDGKNDLVVRDFLGGTSFLLGNGDGTFKLNDRPIQVANGPGVAVADLNGDGNLDVVTTKSNVGEVQYTLGNGDGTFQAETTAAFTGQFPAGVAVADFATVRADGSVAVGIPDGVQDLIVANNGRTLPTFSGPAEVVLLPGLVDDQSRFAGFGDPMRLADAKGPLDVKVGDVNGDGVLDAVVVDRDGILVIYGKKPVISPNDTLPTARNLGTVVHLVEPTQTIVPGRTDAYYTLRVPTEVARGAGDEALDFSGLFQAAEGAGITMDVRDAAGTLLGSGERFRVLAQQGQVLTLHVFGVQDAGGQRGAGAFTLDITVLPQVTSIESQPLLPGQGQNPGGPTASLVITFQGDRLDPATAENPANYRVTWLGPDGLPGTSDDREIFIRSGSGQQSAVYDPSTNVSIASGNVYPTAIRQTVTLLFASPLPAGSYQIELLPGIQTAAFSAEERGLVASAGGLTGHPVVSRIGSQVTEGDRRTALDLVFAAGALGSFDVFETGTPFLTQLHDDLGAVLDAELSRLGDSPTIPGTIDNQILDRFNPALGPAGQRPVAVLVIWLDPVSPTFVDSRDNRVVFNQQDNSFVNTLRRAYVNVTGNLEVIVVTFFATTAETFRLAVANVPATVRGGVVYFGADGNEVRPLTSDLRGGTTDFLLSFGSALAPKLGITLDRQAAPFSEPGTDAATSAQAFTLVGTRTATDPVTAVGPLFRVQVNTSPAESGTAATRAFGRNAGEFAAINGSDGSPSDPGDAAVQQIVGMFADTERVLVNLAGKIRAWFKVGRVRPAVEAVRPVPERPGPEKVPDEPMEPPPEKEDEPLERAQEAGRASPEELISEGDALLPCFTCVVGLGVSAIGFSAPDPNRRRKFGTKGGTDE